MKKQKPLPVKRNPCLHMNPRVSDLTIDRLQGTVVCGDCGAVLRSYDAG